jgi:hypothetical protein
MRRLIVKIVVLLALAWGGWWWIASGGLQRGAKGWLETQQTQGITASVDDWTHGGFPLRMATNAQDIAWADAETGTELKIPTLTLSSPIYWPGDPRIDMPAGPVTITTPQGVATLTTAGAQAEMLLHPGSALQLEALSASSTDVSLDLVEGRVFSMQSMQADIQQGANSTTYTVDLTAFGFAFGSILQEGLQLPGTWPTTFEPIVADMTVTFDRPWDRSALDGNRPQPRAILIEKMEAIYADLGFALAGELTVDGLGIPTGVINLRVRNWQQLFDIVVAATEIPPEWHGTVEQVLGSMADMEGTLDLDITLAQGQMRMGFLPLGPAPRLVIR